MLVELENPSVVKSQPFPNCVAPLHCRIERTNSCLVTMHQLSVDVHNQIAVSLVEFLKHLKLPHARSTTDTKKEFHFDNELCSQRDFNAGDVHKAAGSIQKIADKSLAVASELRSMPGDMVETRWFLRPRCTNTWPKCRLYRATLVPRKASIC